MFLITLTTMMIPVQVMMVSVFRLVANLGPYLSYGAVTLATAAGDGIRADHVAPMIVLLLVFQRYFVQGFTRSGIK